MRQGLPGGRSASGKVRADFVFVSLGHAWLRWLLSLVVDHRGFHVATPLLLRLMPAVVRQQLLRSLAYLLLLVVVRLAVIGGVTQITEQQPLGARVLLAPVGVRLSRPFVLALLLGPHAQLELNTPLVKSVEGGWWLYWRIRQ